MIFFKKEKEVIELILKHVDAVEECIQTALETIDAYLKGEKDKALQNRIDDWYSPAAIYSLLGMKEKAINILNEQFYSNRERDKTTYLSSINSKFCDTLRDDIQFNEILAKEKKRYKELLVKYEFK